MKIRAIFLLSIAVNLWLIAAIGHRWFAAPLPVEAPSEREPSVLSPLERIKLSRAKAGVVTVVKEERFLWEQLNRENLPEYVKNLRIIGCPETTVQDIIYAAVNKGYAQKIRDLHRTLHVNRDGTDSDFWKSIIGHFDALAERSRKLLKLNRERQELLFSLLEVEVELVRLERYGLPDMEGARVPFLSPAQRFAAKEIMLRFDELENTVTLKYKTYSGPEPALEKEALRKERETELLKIMNGAVLEEYKIRKSRLAQNLRTQLTAFRPEEYEFRALYRIEEKYRKPYQPPPDPEDLAQVKQRQEEVGRMKDEQMLALGPDRFSSLQQATKK